MNIEQIQLKCQQTYIKNIAYLEKEQPEVFKQIALLEIAIDEGIYQEQYALEIVNSSFNIKKLKDDTFIYNASLDDDAKQRVNNITFDDKKGFKSFIPKDIEDNYTINDDITQTHLHHLYPLIQYTQKYSSKEFRLNKLDKFIFFGNLLGRYTELFVQTYSPRIILIVEQNIEIFKLSLFVTDYSEISQNSEILFAITQDQDIFVDYIKKFINEFELFNYILKFDILNNSYFPFIETFLNTLAITSATDFPFSAQLMTIQRQIKLLEKGYKFLDFSKNYNVFSKETPIIIVSPGPSLTENIQWLQQNKQKLIIVAFGATLKTLYKHDIKPNIITSVDPTLDIMNQFENIPVEFYDESILFASSNSPDKLFDIFDKNKTYIYQVIYDLFELGSFGGKSIGDLTYALLLKLNAKTIYLLGTDLCVDDKTGSAHVKEHQHYTELEKVEKHNSIENNNIKDSDLIEIQGNFKDIVLTTRHFKRILELYKIYKITIGKKDIEVFNISNGAKIEETQAIKVEQINNLHDIKAKLIIKDLLNNIIADKCKLKDIESKLFLVNKVIKLLVSYNHKEYNSYNDMMYDKFTVTIDILDILKKEQDITIGVELINSFNDNVEGYINTFFNIKKNQINKKRFNKVFKLWIKPQLTIIEKYKELLENIQRIQ